MGSIPSYFTSGSTQPEWEEEDQPNSGQLHFVHLLRQTNQAQVKTLKPKEKQESGNTAKTTYFKVGPRPIDLFYSEDQKEIK